MSPRTLVTGSSRGIGRALVERLVAVGHEVWGVQRSPIEASSNLASRAHILNADLASESGVERVIDGLPATLTGIVFNAGVALRAEFAVRELEGIDPLRYHIQNDLEAPLHLCRALLVSGKLERGASLVFTSSNLARHGLPGKVAYSAAKAGLEAAVRGLARELGPQGIRVNAVAPGLLRTSMTSQVPASDWAVYRDEVPLRRVGEPADVVGAFEFLLSSAAGYVTGQVLDVDGGWGC